MIGPEIEQVTSGRGATWHENILIPITRGDHRKDVYWTYTYGPIADAAAPNRVGGILVICTETTATVRAKELQERTNERQRRKFEQAPSFICILQGPDHVFAFVNATHRRLFASDDWIGKPAREALPDIAGQGFYELLDQVYRTGQQIIRSGAAARYRRTPSDPEEERFFDFIYAPLTDESGAVTGIFCEGVDATETHLAQQKLRELNARLEREVIERSAVGGQFWQISPDLLGVLKPDGFFERVNPAWSSMLGWSEDEVCRTSIFDLLHPDDVEPMRGGFEYLKQGHPIFRFENRYRRKDGGYEWLVWSAAPYGAAYYCSARNITAEKEQATALAKREVERDLLWRNA